MTAAAEVVLAIACVELVVADVAALVGLGVCPLKATLMARDAAQFPRAGAMVL